jgi:hypothetical protein
VTTCPIPFDQLVEYFASDGSDEIEEHLFGCDACATEAERVAAIVGAFRDQLPPVISHAQLADVARRGLAIEENTFHPGTRTAVTFAARLDLLVHHLAGLDLAGAERVDLTIRSEATGAVLYHDPLAPFDPASGEVLIACQRHFAMFPRDVVFDVEVHHRAAPPAVARYAIPHAFV